MANIKLFARKVIGASKVLHAIYIHFSKANQLFKSKLLIKKIQLKLSELITVKDLVSRMSIIAKKKDSSFVHIIASGSSVLDSYHKIRSNDFVIGFNFSALLNIKFDLYFFELGSEKYKSYSTKQMMLIFDKVVPNGGGVYFKNICDQDNDEK